MNSNETEQRGEEEIWMRGEVNGASLTSGLIADGPSEHAPRQKTSSKATRRHVFYESLIVSPPKSCRLQPPAPCSQDVGSGAVPESRGGRLTFGGGAAIAIGTSARQSSALGLRVVW